MALTFEEQKLYDFAIGSLPSWIKEHDEFLQAAAKMFGAVRAQTDYLLGQALITQATGAAPDGSTPDWLNQHARDRDTGRQASEGDPALQQRLRTFPDAVTRAAILAGVNDVLAAAGVSGQAAMLELPRDAAWIGTYQPMAGVGGAFGQDGTTSSFTPTTLPWPTPPWRSAAVFPERQHQLVITGAANAGNNGTRTITGLSGNATLVTNVSGVAGADPTVTWTVQRLDGLGNVRDGFARSYVGRGWRVTSRRPGKLVVILPFGTDAGTEASVREMLRVKKAAGFGAIVERRMSP